MKSINKSTIYIALGTLLVGVLIGWFFFADGKKATHSDSDASEHAESQIWTCTMHPQIRMTEPGDCPICGMELVSLRTGSSSEDPSTLSMSPSAMSLANVQTSVVEKQKPVKEIRMNGKVKADETRVFSQVSHIQGRIERLMVNFTGESIRKGQIVAYVYSPELATGQEELFEAYKIKESQPELYRASREKLKNWKLTESQIDKILSSGQIQETFPVLSDVSGVVINKRVNSGDYVQKGQALFEVANLSRVWVLFDVYENDIQWMKSGDEVEFSVQSLPGKILKSRISFIDPVIDPARRVASVRIEISNAGEYLKPDMFATGIVKTPLSSQKEALIVPKSSVLWTGKRSVVYVKESGAGANFKMREVTLGPVLGDGYLIKEGLSEGEEVVTNGTFSIDAAAQLAGKPSMMNPEGGAISTGHNHGGMSSNNSASTNHSIVTNKKITTALQPLFNDYLLLKDALVADDNVKAKKIASGLSANLKKVSMGLFKGPAHEVWMEYSAKSEISLINIKKAESITDIRVSFKELSEQFIFLANTFGPFEKPLFIHYCSMYDNNKGAKWINATKEIKNPYYGASMLTCGELVEEIK